MWTCMYICMHRKKLMLLPAENNNKTFKQGKVWIMPNTHRVSLKHRTAWIFWCITTIHIYCVVNKTIEYNATHHLLAYSHNPFFAFLFVVITCMCLFFFFCKLDKIIGTHTKKVDTKLNMLNVISQLHIKFNKISYMHIPKLFYIIN